jgi:hypothetical protein
MAKPIVAIGPNFKINRAKKAEKPAAARQIP